VTPRFNTVGQEVLHAEIVSFICEATHPRNELLDFLFGRRKELGFWRLMSAARTDRKA
jgi:hypothetical protein